MTDSPKNPTIFNHARDITLLPVSITIIVPLLIYDGARLNILDNYTTAYSGLVFLLLGLALFSYTVFLFNSVGKGTLAPWTPTQRLVVAGPYKYCRNPMISGILLILIGQTLMFASFNMMLWTALFFLADSLYFVAKEEPDLQKRFGADYTQYMANVPRWIPRVNPYQMSDNYNERTESNA